VVALLSNRADSPYIAGVVDRVRAVICRDLRHTPDVVATSLCVDVDELRALLGDGATEVDGVFLLDVVAALVQEYGIDPRWLLTGQYDGGVHRHALTLGEDRSKAGRQHLRDFVQAEYNQLREKRTYLSLPPTLEVLREKVASLLRR